MIKPVRVDAVVLAFRPDPASLYALLQGLRPQVQRLWLVDNTPANEPGAVRCLDPAMRADSAIQLLPQPANIGVGAGFNCGIRAALAAGASHILLSDQDSLPAADMLAQLVAAEAQLCASGAQPAALGPSFSNAVNGQPFRFQVSSEDGRRGVSVLAENRAEAFKVSSLISSGCLIRAEVLAAVGLLREDFFIDYVDIEWCYRASAQGYASYVVPQARLQHQLGERPLRVWAGGWRVLTEHSPLRLYFQARNAIQLMRLDYVDRWYRRAQPRFLLGRLYAYAGFSSQRLASLRMLLRGIYDGIRGRLGGPPA